MTYAVQHQTPSAGYISWTGVHIVFNGTDTAVANGSTNKKFVYWEIATPGIFSTSDTYPTLTADDCIVFINKAGVATSVLDAGVTDGSLIVPGTVSAVAIAADAIAADHIAAGAITAGKVAADAISTSNLAAGVVTAAKMAAGSIATASLQAGAVTSDKVTVTSLSAISANMGSITAGDFTLSSTGFIRGGSTGYLTGTGIWMGYHSGQYKLHVGDPTGSGFTWDGSTFTIRGPGGTTLLSSGVGVPWSGVTGATKPADNATVGAPTGTSVGSQAADTVAAATINFNARNDRNASAIQLPVLPGGGSAIDHVINSDGSATMSAEWAWGGDEADIDGWVVTVHETDSEYADRGGLNALTSDFF